MKKLQLAVYLMFADFYAIYSIISTISTNSDLMLSEEAVDAVGMLCC